MTSSYTIRRQTETQALQRVPDLVRIYRDSWLATYPDEAIGLTKKDILVHFSDMDKITNEWKEKELSGENKAVWILEEKESGKVVGFCVARKEEQIHVLMYIYLLPVHEGKGLGKRLMKKALAWLGDDAPIELYGAAHNRRAIRFYEKFGFRLTNEPVNPKILSNGLRIPSMRMVRRRRQ